MRLTVLGCCCSNPATAGFSFPKSPTNPNPSNRFPARSTSVATAGTEASDEPSSVALPLIRRRLILLRHAESTFVGSRVKDHERPLSKPGRRDAMSVAHKLEQMGWIPEVILSSDATRTKETLQILQETAIGFSEAEVYFIPSFYSVAAMDGQTAEHLQSAICAWATTEVGKKLPPCFLVLL
ncbi:Histidine phosphatase superfamily clade-1 protein [Dioscorea alata]|uniref:Histidine phosphatase superfamily clade-1 protein n=1 Tax=Dioscorea alata TaxID=55571 RepID=A0ACB7UJ76_DIOAL|nr:Histidine phosphatase superfamily clade-1 protein [Dioscorea alata]